MRPSEADQRNNESAPPPRLPRHHATAPPAIAPIGQPRFPLSNHLTRSNKTTARPPSQQKLSDKKHDTPPYRPVPHRQTGCFCRQNGLFCPLKRPVSKRKTRQVGNSLSINHLASVKPTHTGCRLSLQPFRPRPPRARAQQRRRKQPCHNEKHSSHKPPYRTACPPPPASPRTGLQTP